MGYLGVDDDGGDAPVLGVPALPHPLQRLQATTKNGQKSLSELLKGEERVS